MLLGTLSVALLCFAIIAFAGGRGSGGREYRGSFSTSIQKVVGYRYLVSVPDRYEPGRTYPLLLFLHGAGERGDDIENVKIHGPVKNLLNESEFGFIVLSPQVESNGWWDSDGLIALIDEIIVRYAVDEERVYVTGLSMGGNGTWELISRYPERFAAAIPVCGWGNRLLIHRAKDVPVWAFHGRLDTVVPILGSEQMAASLSEAGGTARLTIYEDTGHDSWTETYRNKDIYRWLLEHTVNR